MIDLVRPLRNFFVSLKLTVVLLALGIVLVFAATLSQVDLGIWAVQERFFRSFVAIWHVGPLYIPLPGGYLVGGLLLINLTAAHIARFQFTWKKAGIQLTHAGLILLLLGELLSGLWQEDFAMKIDEGASKNYSESYRFSELAITDITDPAWDDVVAIPTELLARGETIQHSKLPFRVVTKAYYPNADLVQRDANTPPTPTATAGFGQRFAAAPQPLTYKQDGANTPAAYIELIGTSGSIGTWLVTTQTPFVQHFEAGGRQWKISLRPQRAYKPFSLTLLEFRFDRYPGTQIPKNFSSRVRLTTPDGKVNREVLIYMNNPLRYEGLTFYQADYDKEKEKYTVLQVVRNPSWLLPYVACIVMVLGLVWQFGYHLVGFIRKRRAAGG